MHQNPEVRGAVVFLDARSHNMCHKIGINRNKTLTAGERRALNWFDRYSTTPMSFLVKSSLLYSAIVPQLYGL